MVVFVKKWSAKIVGLNSLIPLISKNIFVRNISSKLFCHYSINCKKMPNNTALIFYVV
jgi:hypothetical protein